VPVNAFVAETIQELPTLGRIVAPVKPSVSPSLGRKSQIPGSNKSPATACDAIEVVKSNYENDDTLVGRVRGGDSAAFSKLVERYQRRIQQLALSFVRNEHDAQDVVQDAFLRVHLGLRAFRGSSSFYTWLYRIVVNLAIDAKRRPYRQRVAWETIAETADDSRALELPRIRNSDPHEAMTRVELDHRLTVAIAHLPSYHRAVIIMREVDGMSYQEMAECLHISKGTVMSRLFHARRRLQRSLANESVEH